MSEPTSGDLAAAVAQGDADEVRALLEAGASPLAATGEHESMLRAAHARRDAPGGAEVLLLLRRAASEAIEQSAARLNGLATPAGDGDAGAIGLAPLRRALRATRRAHVLAAECEVKTAARALGKLVGSPRREADVAQRPVADAPRLAFLYRAHGSAWTLIPLVFDIDSAWHLERVPELEARGAGLSPLARALAAEAECRVLHVEYDAVTEHSPSGALERKTFEVEDWWVPEGTPPTPDEARALLPDFAGAPDALLEAAAARRERLRRMDAALDELGIRVPPMRVQTDGWGVQLELRGARDVERVDVVVLQELGDAPKDRALGQAPAAPAMVGPGGAPALAHAPPPKVDAPEPAPSSAAPMSNAPPPVLGPQRTTGAPAAPPPIVSGEPAVPNELPDAGDEPAEEPAAEPTPPEPSEPASEPAPAPPPVAAGSAAPNAPPPPVDADEAVPNEPAPAEPEPAPAEPPLAPDSGDDAQAAAPPPMVTDPVVTPVGEKAAPRPSAPPPMVDAEIAVPNVDLGDDD